MSMLEVQNLSVRFGSAVIVNDVSFSVQDGDWLMLIGPNGAGKSTIVNAVSRGVPYTGTVLFEGKDVQKTPAHLLARGMGVLAQHHTGRLCLLRGGGRAARTLCLCSRYFLPPER